MDDRSRVEVRNQQANQAGWLRRAKLPVAGRLLGALLALLVVGALSAASAFANAPNPTSIKVDGYSVKGSEVEITISGTWTWNVPNGAQKDCNDSRIGVGYSVAWGDNTANPLKVQGGNELIYVGTATDNWVHSVTEGTQTVAGPFKKGPAMVEESMLGETPEGMLYGFGPQGISTGATAAVPTKQDAERWVSNCGPTQQSKVNGQTIGNSNPAEPEQGFPSGTWGPISHVYKGAGPFKICPVMYDPHGNEVGGNAGNENQIIAGGQHSNNDNSVESNGNVTPCVKELTIPKLTTTSTPSSALTGQSLKDEAKIEGNNPQGTLSWKLYGPFSSSKSITETSCTGKPVFESAPVTVNGNNTYTSPATTVPTGGVYQWVASFTSTNNNSNLSVGPVGCGEAAEQVKVQSESFEVIKKQKFSTGGSFTTEKLKGVPPATVEYEIVVKNTGETTLAVEKITDANVPACDKAPLKSPLAAGEEAVEATCSMTYPKGGTFTNVALVEGNKKPKESPPVEVELEPQTKFEVIKKQKFSTGGSFTTEKLKGVPPATVEYEIVVKNTGETSLAVEKITDANVPACDKAPLKSPLAAGEEAVEATCSMTYPKGGTFTNVALVEGNKKPKESPPVEVELEPQTKFEVIKEQRFAGEPAYTTAKLTGVPPKTVEYEIVVKNTGETTLAVEKITDANVPACDKAPLKSPLAAGEEAVEATCSMTYPKGGTFTNVALVEGNKKPKESPPVEVELEPQTKFEVIKKQKFSTGGSFTTEKLKGVPPATVEYEIVVKNTGETTLAVEKITDANVPACDKAPLKSPLAAGEEAVEATCSMTYPKGGTFTNVALVEGNKKPKESPPVEVELEPQTKFEVIKKQKFSTGGSFTTEKLKGVPPATVEYEIVVKNTGETTLAVEKITDANVPACDKAPLKSPLAAGEEAVEATCSMTYPKGGTFTNVALVEGNKKPKESPPVEVELEPQTKFEVIKKQKFSTGGSFTTEKLKGVPPATVEYEIVVKNTGETTLAVEKITDANVPACDKAPLKSPLAAGEEAVEATCSMTYPKGGTFTNVALVEGNKKPKESPPVEVELEPQTKFEVIKEQRFAGEAAYRTGKLTGKAPKTVEYEIIVKNTGETTLALEKITDANASGCETAPAKASLAPNEEAVEATCSMTYTKGGTFTNVALVEGNKKKQPSNEVEVELATPTEGFEVIKEQRFSGEAAYRTGKLSGVPPKTVEYEIIVKNIGEASLAVEKVTDANAPGCEGVAAKSPLASGESAVEATCSVTYTKGGTFKNVALVEANKKKQPSNEVEVVLATQSFESVKEQKLSGSTAGYTKEKLTGKIGETIDYRITATNTGEAPETFPTPVDPGCSTLSGGPTGPVPSGQSTSWTCERQITASGVYENVAVVTGNEEPHPTNKVVVEVPKQEPKAVCAISEPSIQLHGANGSKRKTFTVRISSLGIKEITFFLDGKKLKKLTSSQAKNGQFEVKINPNKLPFGAHKVSVKTIMTDPTCANIARAGVFVHPKPATVTPKFTG